MEFTPFIDTLNRRLWILHRVMKRIRPNPNQFSKFVTHVKSSQEYLKIISLLHEWREEKWSCETIENERGVERKKSIFATQFKRCIQMIIIIGWCIFWASKEVNKKYAFLGWVAAVCKYYCRSNGITKQTNRSISIINLVVCGCVCAFVVDKTVDIVSYMCYIANCTHSRTYMLIFGLWIPHWNCTIFSLCLSLQLCGTR